MGLSPWQFQIQERLQARLMDLQTERDELDRKAPYAEEARQLRHERHRAMLHHLIGEVEGALGKVKDGTYGRCDGCGADIPQSTLESEPATTLCAPCRGHA